MVLRPRVLDLFAGGGSIPFEATKYGLNVIASDLNPVAVVTMKAAMEYPLITLFLTPLKDH
jgi:putative DNA methylase